MGIEWRRTIGQWTAWVVAAGIGVGLLAGGCAPEPTGSGTAATTQSSSAESVEATKAGDGRRRVDPAPLVSRLPALGSPESVVWYSGTLGDVRVPGPSTYWIDAVVTLDPATEATLRALDPSVASGAPDVVDALAGDLPAGRWATGAALDDHLAADGWHVRAWLAQDSPVLVIAVVGQ